MKGLGDFIQRAAGALTLVTGANGETLGRACISAGFASSTFESTMDLSGVVTVGGLAACGLSGIIGVLKGEPIRTSRDAARPLIEGPALARWAEEQADLVPLLWSEPEKQSACAQYIRMCGGHTKDLPIAYRQGKWWSANEIAMIADLPEVALIVDPLTIEYRLEVLKTYELYESVFVARFGGQPGLLQTGHHHTVWPNAASGDWHMPALGLAVVESLARAWHAPLTDVLAANDLQRESDVVIGRDGDRELRAEALVIRKPTTMLEKAGPSN